MQNETPPKTPPPTPTREATTPPDAKRLRTRPPEGGGTSSLVGEGTSSLVGEDTSASPVVESISPPPATFFGVTAALAASSLRISVKPNPSK